MKKPVVSFMDGATSEPIFLLEYILSLADDTTSFLVGGGVGLSVHASFRIATENTVFAMPEVSLTPLLKLRFARQKHSFSLFFAHRRILDYFQTLGQASSCLASMVN